MAHARRPTLVVGATGQLGSRIVRRLVELGHPVRAFVRPQSGHARLPQRGVEKVFGDLTDPSSVDDACRGAGVVMATANSVVPIGQTGFEAVEGRGYGHLIEACQRHAVDQIVMISVPAFPGDQRVPTFRYKRLNEQRVRASGLPHTILRAAPFMDDWFAFIGSRLPARGDAEALVNRPWGFLQTFMGVVGNLVEQRGIALIPGPTRTRHAFIAIDDVAEYMVRAAGHPATRDAVLDIGGPQVLSWDDVAALFAQVLGRPVRSVSTPRAVFRAQQLLMRPFSEAASNIMGLNWAVSHETPFDSSALAVTLGVKPTRAEQFLRAQAARPAA
jgi:uncharacterized protein YbjT (DUF2867 family)